MAERPPTPSEEATAPWIATLRGLLRERLGLEVPPPRARGEIAAFARARAQAVGLEDPGAWIERAAREGDGEEWRHLVAAATVGETYFYRHPEQLEALVGFSKARAADLSRPLEVWSAGCSTGEEAWSLAIALAEAGVAARVLGTDVNARALAQARGGAGFRARSVAHLPDALRPRWLVQDGETWRLARPGALQVTFAPHNLAHEAPPRSSAPDGRFDLVVCRNVLIYFPQDLLAPVVTRLLGALVPEGGLWLGPADLLPVEAFPAHRDRWAGASFLRARPASRSDRAPAEAPAARPSRGPPRPAPATPRAALPVETLLARGLVASAEEALEARVAASSRDGAAWVALGAIAMARHEFPRALAHLDRAAGLHPPPRGLDYLRGVALVRTGRLEAAGEAFLDALEADPDDWAAALQLALHYRRAGRRLQEELVLERARRLLEAQPPPAPDHGLATHLLDSVHGDASAARRAVAARLHDLAPPQEPPAP